MKLLAMYLAPVVYKIYCDLLAYAQHAAFSYSIH